MGGDPHIPQNFLPAEISCPLVHCAMTFPFPMTLVHNKPLPDDYVCRLTNKGTDRPANFIRPDIQSRLRPMDETHPTHHHKLATFDHSGH